jgi:predicted nucleic acid-binding protein
MPNALALTIEEIVAFDKHFNNLKISRKDPKS